MTQTITTIPELVTSGGDVNEVLTINNAMLNRIDNPILLIEVVSGTFLFAAGEDASNSSASYTAGQKAIIPLLKNGFKYPEVKLNFKAANISETFKITGI